MNLKFDPYKTGINFYIILITIVFTFLGCKSFEKYQERQQIKRQAEDILNTPNLTKIK